MPSISWRLTIFESDDTTQDFQITNSHLVDPPTIAGQKVNPLEGTAESLSWEFNAGNFSNYISTRLGDGDNRQALGGRRIDAEIDRGSGFVTVWSGRISGVAQASGPGMYTFRCSDELFRERKNTIFDSQSLTATGKSTTQLYPAGLREDWYSNRATFAGKVYVSAVAGNYVELTSTFGGAVSDNIVEALKANVKEGLTLVKDSVDGTTGNFDNLVVSVGGSEYQVLGVNTYIDSPQFVGDLGSEAKDVSGNTKRLTLTRVLLAWGTSPPTVDTEYDDFSMYFDENYIPNEDVPLHIGGSEGIEPFSLIKDIFDEIGIRYDANVFSTYNETTNPLGLLAHPHIPKMFFRITSPENAQKWLQEKIYKPLGIVPFVNNAGEVSPRRVLGLPTNVDPTTYTEVTVANANTFPDWDYSASSAITQVVADWWNYRTLAPANAEKETDWPADKILVHVNPLPPISHDRLDDLGTRAITLDLSGVPGYSAALRTQQGLAVEIFDRFGDGPQTGTFQTSASLDSVSSGDFLRLSFDEFPNASEASGTGGTRIVQILDKKIAPTGPIFRYLDAGPNLQPLTAPSVSVAAGADSKHEVTATITGVPSLSGYVLQARVNNVARPGDLQGYQNNVWFTVATGVGNEVVSIAKLPSGTSVDFRVQSTNRLRIRSAWSTIQNIVTTSLAAPTTVAATINGRSITITWVNTETRQWIRPLAAIVPAGPADFTERAWLPSSSTYTFDGLLDATQYELGIQYVDRLGGASADATVLATTSGTVQLNAPRQFTILQAKNSSTGNSNPPESEVVGTGLEVSWKPSHQYSATILQVATDVGFTTIVRDYVARAGQYRMLLLDLPEQDGVTYYVRAKHQATGFDDSAWSSILSGSATQLLADGGADSFAAGYAFLDLDSDDNLLVNIGTFDPDTDAAWYRIFVNPVDPTTYPPNPDTASPWHEVVNTSLPFEGAALDDSDVAITLQVGDVAYLTVGFFNEVKGFGSEVRAVFRYAPQGDIVSGRLRAVVNPNNGTADLYGFIVGPTAAFPVNAEIYQESPTGSVLQAHTFTASGQEIGPGDYGTLNDIALPQKAAVRWWMKMVDALGAEFWAFSMADRNKLPGGSVTPQDNAAQPQLKSEYDDDVTTITIATNGKTKTYSGLSGGGSLTYTHGVDDFDGAPGAEDDLRPGELSNEYIVTFSGGGTSRVMFKGQLRGKIGEGAGLGPEIGNVRFIRKVEAVVGERGGMFAGLFGTQTADVYVEIRHVNAEVGGQGTLEIWTNPNSPNDGGAGSPSSPTNPLIPDDVITINHDDLPAEYGPTDSTALASVIINPSRTKKILLRYTANTGDLGGSQPNFAIRQETTGWVQVPMEVQIQSHNRGGDSNVPGGYDGGTLPDGIGGFRGDLLVGGQDVRLGGGHRGLTSEEFELDWLGGFPGARFLSPTEIRDTSGLTQLMDAQGKAIQNLLLESTVTDDGGRALNLFLAKEGSSASDDSMDSVRDGTLYRKVISVTSEGRVSAAGIDVASLTAITSVLGTVQAGVIVDSISSPVSAIRFDPSFPISGYSTYIDMVRTGTYFLRHPKMSLRQDGSALFDSIDIASGITIGQASSGDFLQDGPARLSFASDGSTRTGLRFLGGTLGTVAFQYWTGLAGTQLGFYGVSPVSRQTIPANPTTGEIVNLLHALGLALRV